MKAIMILEICDDYCDYNNIEELRNTIEGHGRKLAVKLSKFWVN